MLRFVSYGLNDAGGIMSEAIDTPTKFTDRGLAAGFDSLDREVRVESLPLHGRLPDWLRGTLLRTGPGKWEASGGGMRHWFDGLAMLHRFAFADGQVSYANRFLRTRAYRAIEETGAIGYSEFATDPCRSLFSRVMSV